MATGQLLAPHKVRYQGKDGSKEVTGEHVILTGDALWSGTPAAST